MTEFKLLGMIAALFFGDPTAEMNSELQAIDSMVVPQIAPVPEFTAGTPVSYEVKELRNPFIRASLHREMKLYAPKRVVVNEARAKQPLELYALESLKMIGVVKKSANYDAMILSPNGQVQVVRVGDYLGQNHGRVTKIESDSMVIAEAIPDGDNGYIEHSRTMVVVEKQADGI